jgi:hypothetical protein
MKQNFHLILWILTIVLMTLAIADEFLSGQPLSLLGFVFVLALALSALGAAVEEWTGRDSSFSRFWRSRAFSTAVFAVTFLLVVVAMIFLP